MLLKFLQLNRHFFKVEKEILVFNKDYTDDDKLCADNYPPLPLEQALAENTDDSAFFELDDRYSESELVFGILVNRCV